MSRRSYDLLSLSIVLIGLGLGLMLSVLGIIGPLEVVPLVVALLGGWYVVLSTIRKGEPRGFSTLSWGILLFLGGVMGMASLRFNFSVYFIPVILIALGSIGIIAAMRNR